MCCVNTKVLLLSHYYLLNELVVLERGMRPRGETLSEQNSHVRSMKTVWVKKKKIKKCMSVILKATHSSELREALAA